MATLNKAKAKVYTHEGAQAASFPATEELRRLVMSCLLWEDQFYESGSEQAANIESILEHVPFSAAFNIASEARLKMHLRHVPLFIAAVLARRGERVAGLLELIIQRPDELTEFMAIYWRNGRCPLSSQVKKGLARAFTKFNQYQLAKYVQNNASKAIKLRDVLFLCHAIPRDKEQAEWFKQLAGGTLPAPDTWEVELRDSTDKKASWTRLLSEKKLGSMALVRNLRNMINEGVSKTLIRQSLVDSCPGRMMPYRFIAAAQQVPIFERELETVFRKCCEEDTPFLGSTLMLVDVSYSMQDQLSDKSNMTRLDAACGLAMILAERCQTLQVYTFSNQLVEVAPRKGFALRDAIVRSQDHHGTRLGKSIECLKRTVTDIDRMIVITDEQTHDHVSGPIWKHPWIVNVASYKHGVGLGQWRKVNGWSQGITKYIEAYEESYGDK